VQGSESGKPLLNREWKSLEADAAKTDKKDLNGNQPE
jgi:hypothetical protein